MTTWSVLEPFNGFCLLVLSPICVRVRTRIHQSLKGLQVALTAKRKVKVKTAVNGISLRNLKACRCAGCTCLQQGGGSRTKPAGLISAAFIPVSFPHPPPLAVFHFSLPLISLPQGLEVSVEIRQVRQDLVCETIWLYAINHSNPSQLPGLACKDELQRESSREKLRPPFWWNQSQSRRRKDANVAVSPSFTLGSDGFSPNKRSWPRLNKLAMRSGSLANEGRRLSSR